MLFLALWLLAPIFIGSGEELSKIESFNTVKSLGFLYDTDF